MNRIMIFIISAYQSLPVSAHKNCKFYPTCSEYAKEAYKNYNFFYASYLTGKRLLKCVPWNHDNLYDPIEEVK